MNALPQRFSLSGSLAELPLGSMTHGVSWILLGLIAGAIARKVMPGEEPGGFMVTIVLGILGAVVGGWIGRHVGYLPTGVSDDWFPSLDSVITATIGALVVLLLWKWLRK